MPERPIRRWTLRELLNGSERYSRELIDAVRKEVLPTMRDVDKQFHRRRVDETALKNATRQLLYQTSQLTEQLSQLDEIYRAIGRAAEREVEDLA